jgi:hypothetical protein
VLNVRANSSALRLGDVDFPDAPEPLLVLRRRLVGETVICLFNLGTEEVAVPEGLAAGFNRLFSSASDGKKLASHGVWIGRQ